jgi:hypothetical protein
MFDRNLFLLVSAWMTMSLFYLSKLVSYIMTIILDGLCNVFQMYHLLMERSMSTSNASEPLLAPGSPSLSYNYN